jgi:hypothetical protein
MATPSRWSRTGWGDAALPTDLSQVCIALELASRLRITSTTEVPGVVFVAGYARLLVEFVAKPDFWHRSREDYVPFFEVTDYFAGLLSDYPDEATRDTRAQRILQLARAKCAELLANMEPEGHA